MYFLLQLLMIIFFFSVYGRNKDALNKNCKNYNFKISSICKTLKINIILRLEYFGTIPRFSTDLIRHKQNKSLYLL